MRLSAERLEVREVPATLSGAVFNDLIGNGVREPGDAGIPNVLIELDTGLDNVVDASTRTDASGNYSFADVASGPHRVRRVIAAARVSTTPSEYDIDPTADESITGVDFGGFLKVPVSGTAFYDRNGNAARDATEPGLGGVAVTIDINGDDEAEFTTTTAADGTYAFPNQGPGVYRIRTVTPEGYSETLAAPPTVEAASGGKATSIDLGFFTAPGPAAIGTAQYAVGAGAGGGPVVRVLNADGSERFAAVPFPSGFTGGVRTAAADFDADGIADVVAGTGPGMPTEVRILSGADGRLLTTVQPFEAAFTGGVYVAAGDLTGDGVPDLIVSPDEGGGPRVVVFRGGDFAPLASFLGIDDANFRGGLRLAAGDLNADGRVDLAVAAGFGGGPRVALFDGTTVLTTPARLAPDRFVYEPALRNGAFVALGDVDGDGVGELVTAAGPGGAPRVTVFAGPSLAADTPTVLADFFVGDPDGRGGVRVAVKNLDGDGLADILVGDGAETGSVVTRFLGRDLLADGGPAPESAVELFPEFFGGVYIG